MEQCGCSFEVVRAYHACFDRLQFSVGVLRVFFWLLCADLLRVGFRRRSLWFFVKSVLGFGRRGIFYTYTSPDTILFFAAVGEKVNFREEKEGGVVLLIGSVVPGPRMELWKSL